MPELFFYLLAFICCAALFGLVGAAIGQRKGRGAVGFFFGALLGPIGWLIIAIGPDLKSDPKATPAKGAAADSSWQKTRTADDDVAKWIKEQHLARGVDTAALESSAEPGAAGPAQSLPYGKKKCPFCAEVIQAEAIKCRYCASDLSATA